MSVDLSMYASEVGRLILQRHGIAAYGSCGATSSIQCGPCPSPCSPRPVCDTTPKMIRTLTSNSSLAALTVLGMYGCGSGGDNIALVDLTGTSWKAWRMDPVAACGSVCCETTGWSPSPIYTTLQVGGGGDGYCRTTQILPPTAANERFMAIVAILEDGVNPFPALMDVVLENPATWSLCGYVGSFPGWIDIPCPNCDCNPRIGVILS
jgi:hypothetical protein